MLKVDFHTHTHFSKDSLTSIPALIAAARKRGLDRIVVTDHNRLAGALEVQSLAPDLVIPGEEVQTTEGEFLAAYVTQELPRGLEPLVALKMLKDQGAFISVSHPFDPYRSSWSRATLDLLAPQVDAIETHNARMINKAYNEEAVKYAALHGLAGTAGSDSHAPSEIGQMYSLLPDFNNAESLRVAIRSAQSYGRISSPLVHFYSVWAKVVKAVRKSGNEIK